MGALIKLAGSVIAFYGGTKLVSYGIARIRRIPERNIIDTFAGQHGR
jgi:hypothetical protein